MNMHSANNGNGMVPVFISYFDAEGGEERRVIMIMTSMGMGV
jgi:hypothetical protein